MAKHRNETILATKKQIKQISPKAPNTEELKRLKKRAQEVWQRQMR